MPDAHPDRSDEAQVDEDMETADTANGEGSPDDAGDGADDEVDPDGVNDTERRYGDEESPA